MLSIFKSGTHMEWSKHRTGSIWALCPGLCILGIPDTLGPEQLIPLRQVLGWRLEDKLGLFFVSFFLGGGGKELSQWQGALLLLKCLFLFYMASTVWILLPLSLDFPGNVFFFYSRHAADAHLIFQDCPSGLLMKSQSFCIPGPAFRIRL